MARANHNHPPTTPQVDDVGDIGAQFVIRTTGPPLDSRFRDIDVCFDPQFAGGASRVVSFYRIVRGADHRQDARFDRFG